MVLLNRTMVPGNVLPGNGSGPLALAVDGTNGYVYVADSDCYGGDGEVLDCNVTVINGATHSVVVPTIQVGAEPEGLAFDSSNGYVYVANYNSGNVTVINGSTNTVVVPSIEVGEGPEGIAFDSSNGYVYVANYFSDNVTVINGSTNTVVVPSIPVGWNPYSVGFDGRNGYVYVANSESDNLTVINGTNETVIGSVPVGSDPDGVAFDGWNGNVYVANGGSDNLTVISGTNDTVIGSVPVGSVPEAVVIGGPSGAVYVVDSGDASVTLVNGTTDEEVGSISVGRIPVAAAYDASTGSLYVANEGSNNVSVITGTTDTVIASIPLVVEPEALAYDSSNGYLYVADDAFNDVLVVNGTTGATVGSIPLSAQPLALAYDGTNGDIYVTTDLDSDTPGNLTVIAGANDTVVGSVLVGNWPSAVAIDSSTGYLWVANLVSGNVTVVNSSTDAVVASVYVGWGADGVAIDSTNGYVFVPELYSGDVGVINSSTDAVVAYVDVGNGPDAAAFDPANGYVYVANSELSDPDGESGYNVTVVNGSNLTGFASIPTGDVPRAIGVDPANGFVYVADWGSNDTLVVNGATNTTSGNFTIGDLAVGANPDSVAFNSRTGLVYVGNYVSGSISVIRPNPAIVAGGITPAAPAVDPGQSLTLTAHASGGLAPYAYQWYAGASSVCSGDRAISGAYNSTYTASLTGTTSYCYEVMDSAAPSVNATSAVDWVSVGAALTAGSVTASSLIVYTGQGVTVTAHPTGGVQPYHYQWYAGTAPTCSSDPGVPTATASTYTALLTASRYYCYQVTDSSPGAPAAAAISGTLLVTFRARYGVLFEEVGLPALTRWTVDIAHDRSFSSESREFRVALTNGSYSYTIGISGAGRNRYSALGGSFVVQGGPVTIRIPFVVSYPVTFTQTTLPKSMEWWVNASGGTSERSVTTEIRLYEPNGSYIFAATPVNPRYGPVAGTFTVNGRPVSEIVKFARNTFEVTFVESKLPPGIEWWVNITGGVSGHSTGSHLTTWEKNGEYRFTWASRNPQYGGSVATFRVNGKSLSVQAKFTRFVPVTFTEVGLPAHAKWWVNVTDGPSNRSVEGTLKIWEPNLADTYVYTAASANARYGAKSGGFNISGDKPLSLRVTFTRSVPVTFTETGLPRATEWWVNVTDGPSNHSTGNTLKISEWNGEYAYTLASSNPKYGGRAATFHVSGSPVSVGVKFSMDTLAVTFKERGLPAGTEWWVNVTGGVNKSTTATSLQVWEQAGKYHYTVGSANTKFGALDGRFGVPSELARGPVDVEVTFSSATSTLHFTESSLPRGTLWWVNITDGPSLSSTSNAVSFTAHVGNYTYTVGSSNFGYAGLGGKFAVLGKPGSASLRVTFYRGMYVVTFQETGLPAGAEWGVVVDDHKLPLTTATSFSYLARNGTLSFKLTTTEDGFKGTSGKCTVTGVPLTVAGTFEYSGGAAPSWDLTMKWSV